MKSFGEKDGILIGEVIQAVEHNLLNRLYDCHISTYTTRVQHIHLSLSLSLSLFVCVAQVYLSIYWIKQDDVVWDEVLTTRGVVVSCWYLKTDKERENVRSISYV